MHSNWIGRHLASLTKPRSSQIYYIEIMILVLLQVSIWNLYNLKYLVKMLMLLEHKGSQYLPVACYFNIEPMKWFILLWIEIIQSRILAMNIFVTSMNNMVMNKNNIYQVSSMNRSLFETFIGSSIMPTCKDNFVYLAKSIFCISSLSHDSVQNWMRFI